MKIPYTVFTLLATTIGASLALSANVQAEENKQIVASIKPLHSLVNNITKDISKPGLILNSSASPHTYNLKPSEATKLSRADVIFWIGPQVEAFLQKPLASLASSATVVSFLQPATPSETHEENDNHEENEKHDHEKHSEHDNDHGHDHDDGFDPHIWLNPQDSKEIVEKIAATLIRVDPANMAKYQANLQATLGKLDKLDTELASKLGNVGPILVFHNAYTHLAERYKLNIAGVLVHNPGLTPGAKRIRKISQQIKTAKATCIFSEPQFNSKLIDTIARDTNIKTGTLDPLASNLTPGPNLYFDMMHQIADTLARCN